MESNKVFAALAEEAWDLRQKDPERFKRSLKTLEADLSPEERVSFLREYGKLDLFFFGRDILGNQWLTEEVHGDLAKWIYSGRRWKLVLLPRGSLKTTYLTQIATIHNLIRDPDSRTLINSEVHENSKAMLRAITGQMVSNETFVNLYGNLCGTDLGLPWTNEEATISSRTNLGLKESSIETSGLDVVKVSRHYTRIVHDDLQSLRNVRSSEAIEKVKEVFRLSLPLLEKDGELWVIGTRWDDQDLYSYIQEILKDKFDCYIRGAYKDGKLLYPERLDENVLAERRIVLTPYEFSCQYLNDPVTKEEALLWPDKIGVDDSEDTIKKSIKGIAIDPSLGESRHSDYSAVVVATMNKAQDLTLIDGWFGRVTVPVLSQKVIEFAKKYKVFVIGCEKVGMSTIGNDIQRELKAARIPARFVELKPAGRSKESRIMGLQGFLASGRFKLHKDFPIRKDLEYQMARFPRAKYDDLLDAVAYLPDMLRPYAFPKRDPKPQGRQNYYHDPYTGQDLSESRNSSERPTSIVRRFEYGKDKDYNG